MSTKYHQISLKDTFSDCQELLIDDSPAFFQLLDQFVDLELFISRSFFNAFYQKIFSIPSDSLLILKAYYKNNPDIDPYKMA